MVSGTQRHRRRGRTSIARWALAAALAISPAAASAQCTFLVAQQMRFTGYSPFGPGASATSTVIYRCNNVPQAWIGISTPRVIVDGGESLQLETYQEAAHTTVWPEAPPRPVAAAAFNVVVVYGFLPPQDAAPGRYTGTVQLSLYSGTAGNRTDTVNLTVRATVADECVIEPAALAFGSYYPLSATPLDAQSTIRIACTRTTPYTVGLGTGNNPAGALRQMSGGGPLLQYQLYSDAARTVVWDVAATVGATAASTAPVDLPVYGRVVAGQMVPMGPYQDVVQSTINF
jgi:spore coat protein U-like protein